jgi:hypothetical protein
MTEWGSRALDAQKALRSDPESWKRFLRELGMGSGVTLSASSMSNA